VNEHVADLITVFLLGRLFAAAALLLIVVAIACPLVWSADATRRARAREALRLLARLRAWHR
jgi:hypothetical protein